LRAFDAALANIIRHPRSYQEIFGSVRRAMLRRFPYAIIFKMEGDDIVILACLHMSRDPARWHGRT
jgi:plasmid stabilization system protein ParE